MHFPFSAHGLFFLSTAWISGSFFSFSSINSRILKIDTKIKQEYKLMNPTVTQWREKEKKIFIASD